MAVPKVFISSTCYDLSQIRDNLFEFIKSYYYEPVLSEKGDVFYHPDIHTHDSCINEIENCQLFILLIGGRFGGKYKYDTTKSITNAEYEAAKLKNIPVLTFIKRDVYEDHRVYQENKNDEDLVKRISFPSIENQDYAIQIFKFIDRVRLSDVNNGFFSFEYANQIKENLGKQWAGLMHDFLTNRIKYKDSKLVSKTLDNLTLINRKTEELVENIFLKISPDDAVNTIKSTDKIIEGARFLSSALKMFGLDKFSESAENIAKINPTDIEWFEFLEKTGDMVRLEENELNLKADFEDEELFSYAKNAIAWLKTKDKEVFWICELSKGEPHAQIISIMNNYAFYQELTEEERRKAIEITTANNV